MKVSTHDILLQVKSASKACEGLCTWVLAMEVYERVIKVVKPKQAKLAEAEAELAVQMEKLTAKQAELKEVEDALKVLNDQVSFMVFRSNSCFLPLFITSLVDTLIKFFYIKQILCSARRGCFKEEEARRQFGPV